MSKDIEIIDIGDDDDDDLPQTTSEDKLMNLSQHSSIDEEKDIHCLNRGFNPASKIPDAVTNLKQGTPIPAQITDKSNESNVSTVASHNQIPFSEISTQMEISSSVTDLSNCFSSDEECIDDNLVVPPNLYQGRDDKMNGLQPSPTTSSIIGSAEFHKSTTKELKKKCSLPRLSKSLSLQNNETSTHPSLVANASISSIYGCEIPLKRLKTTSQAQVGLKDDNEINPLVTGLGNCLSEMHYLAIDSGWSPLSQSNLPASKCKSSGCIECEEGKSGELVNILERRLKECYYRKPPGTTLFDLIIIILKNCKCLVYGEIWNYISGLFPYFEFHFTVLQGIDKIRRVTHKARAFFLRTSELITKSNRLLIMLNPVTKREQNLVTTNILAKRSVIMDSMYKPEYFDPLVAGSLSLTSVELFRLRKNHVSVPQARMHQINHSSSDDGSSNSQPTTLLTSNDTPPLSICAQSPSSVCTAEDKSRNEPCSSPKSTSSTDTVLFDPQITNYHTVRNEELEPLLKFDMNVDERIGSCNPEYPTPFKDLNTSILGHFDTNQNPNDLGSSLDFSNTVWTSDEAAAFRNTVQPPAEEDSSELSNSKKPPNFPEVERCVPKWKEIFPWISWKPWAKKIFCTTCQEIIHSIAPGETIVVMEITHPDDVFKVSKNLRAHSEKNQHKMAFILQNKSFVSTIYFLLNSHFSEFTSVSEILSVLEDLFGKSFRISQDTLKCALSMLGQYLEDRIVDSLIEAKRFAVITDPCEGLLIVRWLNDTNEPEEHIISSFGSVKDKTANEYLVSLGVNIKNLVSYVTNSRCESCMRCKLTKKFCYKNSTPLRLPQLDRYLVFLWRRKVLKPFYSLGAALCKLWLSYPHKFIEIGKVISWDRLTKFPSNPDTFLDVFQHFEKFKAIAADIYSLTGNLEALGLQKFDLSNYTWILDLFPLLTQINIFFMEIKVVNPFQKDFEVLCHHVAKFQSLCEKIKADIKSNKINLSTSLDDIDEVYFVVQMTAQEFQQNIYHKGKAVSLAYTRLTCVQNLKKCSSNSIMQHTFIVLFTAIRSHFRYNEFVLQKSLENFLTEYKHLEKANATVVLEFFQKNPAIAKDFNVVLAFYKLLALYPFQPAKHERCFYEIKVYNYLFHRSAWAEIGPNIKDHILTIISELNGKSLLSEQAMRNWWKQKIKT